MLSDNELVRRAAAGDRDAFESLVRKHRGRVFSVVFSLLGNSADADDVAQEVFLKAWLSLRSFKGRSSLSTWLYRIAVNESLSAAKRRKRRTVSLDAALAGHEELRLEDLLRDTGDGGEDRAVRREAEDLVRAMILALPEKYRAIVTLRDIEDLSYEEIAQVMGISMEKVKVWLFRARRALKGMIEQRTGGSGDEL